VHRPARLRSLHILEEIASETGRDQHRPVPASLPLHHTDVALIQVHILQPYSGQFDVPQPGEDQHFNHDHVRWMTGLPDGLVEREQLAIDKQGGVLSPWWPV
jgi:hypothetical protein